MRIPTDDPAARAAQMLPTLGADTRMLRSIEIVRPSLESVYLTVTGRKYASDESGRGTRAGRRVISPRRVGVILGHELRLSARDPLPVMILVVFPIITMAFLKPAFRPALVQGGFAHANGSEHVVPGQAVLSAFFIVSLTTFAFFSEFGWMTWDRLRASPATSLEIVLGKAIPRVAMVIVQLFVILGAGVLLFDLHIRGNALALVPLICVFSLALVMLGVAVTAVCRTAQQANSCAVVGMMLFGAIGGALVPFNVLPALGPDRRARDAHLLGHARFRSVILDGRGLRRDGRADRALAAMTLALHSRRAAPLALRRNEDRLGVDRGAYAGWSR